MDTCWWSSNAAANATTSFAVCCLNYVNLPLMFLRTSFFPGPTFSSQHQLAGTTAGSGGSGAFPFVSSSTSMGVHPQHPTVPSSSANPYHSAYYSQSQPGSVFQPSPMTSTAPLPSVEGSQMTPMQPQSMYMAPPPSQVMPTPPQQRRDPNGVCVCGAEERA